LFFTASVYSPTWPPVPLKLDSLSLHLKLPCVNCEDFV